MGLIDADVYGPTIPLMFGMAAVAPASHDGKLVPPERHGVKVVSMGFFLEDDEPVIWRGPMLGRAMEQFLGDVLWGSPDYLLIDLPPGTGDIALTIAQMLPSAEMIVVTTPQEAAAKIAAKAAKMAVLTKHRIIGVVENMSYFICPSCGEKHFIFGHGGRFRDRPGGRHHTPGPHPARRSDPQRRRRRLTAGPRRRQPRGRRLSRDRPRRRVAARRKDLAESRRPRPREAWRSPRWSAQRRHHAADTRSRSHWARRRRLRLL